MIDWKKYFVGVSYSPIGLFIGTGKLYKNGEIKYQSKSGDRTVEMVNAVARFMRIRLNQNKKQKFFGYDIPNAGKLVLIRPGYDFQVYKHKEEMPEKPIQDI